MDASCDVISLSLSNIRSISDWAASSFPLSSEKSSFTVAISRSLSASAALSRSFSTTAIPSSPGALFTSSRSVWICSVMVSRASSRRASRMRASSRASCRDSMIGAISGWSAGCSWSRASCSSLRRSSSVDSSSAFSSFSSAHSAFRREITRSSSPFRRKVASSVSSRSAKFHFSPSRSASVSSIRDRGASGPVRREVSGDSADPSVKAANSVPNSASSCSSSSLRSSDLRCACSRSYSRVRSFWIVAVASRSLKRY